MKIAVIGGDERLWYCAKRLAEKEYPVFSYRLALPPPAGVSEAATPSAVLDGAGTVILPIPVSGDGGRLNGIPDLTPGEILALCPPGTLLFGGNFSAALTADARRRGVPLTDYLNLEPFVLRNAYLTAQGALGILLHELPVCLYHAPIAMLGFGRIAKFLSRMLVSLGAEVTVFARRESDRAMASLIGMGAAHPESLADPSALSRFTAVVNTAPARLLRQENISSLSRGTLLLELASGFDNLPEPTPGSGVRMIFAHSLPGRCFPRSAGEIVCEATEEVLRRSPLPPGSAP